MNATPDAPEGTVPEEPDTRAFTVAGVHWLGRLAGVGLGGTGRAGTAPFALIHVFQEGESAPRFEALVPPGRFHDLYDSELAELLGAARPLPPPRRA